jgi:hypothetical protein
MYQITRHIFYLPGASPPSPIFPILLIPFSSKIDPLGIKCLTFLRHARNSGFTVAQGQSCACDCEARIGSLAIPVVKIAPQQPKLKIEVLDSGKRINVRN